MCEI